MTLLKRITIIFASVTIVSSASFYFIGNSIVKQISSGEFNRGAGRSNGVQNIINGEVNKISSKIFEFSNYIEINSKLNRELDIAVREDIAGLLESIETAPFINTVILLDENMNIVKTLKDKKENLNSKGVKNLLLELKEMMNSIEYQKKGIIRGIVNTEELPYIIGLKKINIDKDKVGFICIIEAIDNNYIKDLEIRTSRVLELVKVKGVESIDDASYIKTQEYNREFYSIMSEDCISVFSNLPALNSENEFFLKLTDTREVRENAELGINGLLLVVISLTITANVIVYILIKKKVVLRILNINKAINSVKEGIHLDLEIIDNGDSGDEISKLKKDINDMFRRLKGYSDNLQYIGSHDSLTSIENRYSITRYISKLTREKNEFALLFLDLDNFKVINDNLGHEVGDNLLIKVSADLLEIKEENKNIAVGRLGGDEFIMVKKGNNSEEEIKKLAKRILNKINKLYEISSYDYEIKASMGISFYPQHSKEEGELLQYSDIAMYCSKEKGGNTFEIFNFEMLEPLRIEKMLKSAVNNKEFEVYLQPIYSIKRNKIKGFESLIRWHKDGEIIPPDKFIPISKKTGDIVDIDNYMFSSSIKICKSVLESGVHDFYISINASKLFLKQCGLIPYILTELRENNVHPRHVKIEITEDEIIDDFEYTIEILNKIREIGIEVYLDDFGIGYSSFSHIKVLPVDVIKIDRSIIMDIADNRKTQEIVKTMIILAHNLKMEVVCEGIEELDQVEQLDKLECDNIQGYYFSKPLNTVDFKKFVDKLER